MKTLITAVLAIPAAVLLAVPASADTLHPCGHQGDHSVANVRYDVATINSSYALSMPDDMPQTVCEGLRSGEGETHIVAIGENSGLPHMVAQATVFSSEFHFCPEFY